MALNAVRVRIRRWRRSLGQTGAAVFAMMCLLAGALAGWSWTLSQNVAHLSQEVAQAEALWHERQKAADPRDDPMAALLRALPNRGEINAQIFRLQDLASTHGVVLGEAEYGFSSAEPPFAGRVRVRFRSKSGYGEVRAFLRAAHEAMPALALSRVSFERQRIGDTRLEVALEFVLYFRSGQA